MPATLWSKERDPDTGKLYPTLGAQADVRHLAISPDNRLLAVGGTFTLWLCDLRTGKRTHLLLCGHDGTQSLAFSPNGKLLAAGTTAGTVKIWTLPSGREVHSHTAHTSWASAVTFSPNRQLVASASHDTTVKIWNVATGERQQQLPGREHGVLCVDFSPDGRTIASGHEDGTVRCWNALTGGLRRTLYCQGRQVSSVYFSEDGRTLACSSFDLFQPEKPGAVELWDLESWELLRRWEKCVGWLDSAWLSPQGPFLGASWERGAEKSTCVWNRESGELCYEVKGHPAALSPDGMLLATVMGDEGVSLWETTRGEKVRDLPVPDGVAALRFSPDGNTLLAGFFGFGMGLWSVATGEPLWEVSTHADTMRSLAFSPDGWMAVVGGDFANEVKIWHLHPQAEEVLTLHGHENNVRAVTFDPSGRKVVTASADGTLKVWDAIQGRLLATLLVLPSTDGSVSDEWITYAPSGHYVGSSGADEFVRWQVADELLPAEAFREEFFRPEVVAQALR